MPKSDKPLKTAFTPLRAKLVDLPPPPPKPPQPSAPEPAATAIEPALAPPAAPPKDVKPSKPLPPAVSLALELVNRSDREVCGWTYGRGNAPDTPVITIVLNAIHPEVAAALNAKDAQKLAWLTGLAFAEGLWLQHWKPTWKALQARLRAELLPPEKRNVTGMLFLAETLARHPLVQSVAQRLCTEPLPEDRRLPMGQIALP